jgi:putative ABC transport system permease protein
VRMALGATRSDILVQFLIEAATLTGIGGAIGIVVGLAFARVASVALDVSTPVPMALTVIAVLVSVTIGLVFGMVPARRASRLNPIDALRHE